MITDYPLAEIFDRLARALDDAQLALSVAMLGGPATMRAYHAGYLDGLKRARSIAQEIGLVFPEGSASDAGNDDPPRGN